jgi:hypothetical protein
MTFEIILKSAAIGFLATALLDVWAIVLNKLFGQSRANWGMVGRWVAHLGRGKVFHDNIADAEPVPNELAIGWVFHYAVGILYGLMLVAFAGAGWLASPSFLPAFVLGMVTVLAAWCLLQPGLGLGWFAAKTPNPAKVRLLNIVSHTVFAVGLFGAALLLRGV